MKINLPGPMLATVLLLAPLASFGQAPAPCTDTDCGAGGCAYPVLPYEEFINALPSDRGGSSVPSVADRPFNPEDGPRVLVRGFVVDGVTPDPEQGLTQGTVQAAADAAFARETGGAPDARMTVGHMARVADDVTTFYRNKGYLVAKAFLPVQTIGSDGLVHIQVVEGLISDVVVESNKSYSVKTLRKPSLPLIGTRPQQGPVETALLYTQDYPGVRLFGTFRPGANTGDTKLVLQVQEEDSFDFSVGADNYGNEFTGEVRLRGDASWNNPLGFGDKWDLTLLRASETTFYATNYNVPVGPRGMSAYVGASRNGFHVGGKISQLELKGTINVYTLGTNWRFSRNRFANATASFEIGRKESDLTALQVIQITNDQYEVAVLGLDADRIDTRFKGVDQGTVKVRQGLGGEFTTGNQVDKTFTIGEFRYARIQSLADTQTGVFRLRGQYTSNVLTPLEQFALAGPDAVRAYPVGQALYDSGVYTSVEYRVQAPGFSRAAGPFGRTWGDLFSTILALDYASGRDSKGQNTSDLSGYSAGFQFGIPGTFNLLLQGAQPISSAVATDGKDFRVYGEFTFKF